MHIHGVFRRVVVLVVLAMVCVAVCAPFALGQPENGAGAVHAERSKPLSELLLSSVNVEGFPTLRGRTYSPIRTHDRRPAND